MSMEASSTVEEMVAPQEQDVAGTASVAPVVDRGLVEKLVAGARGQGVAIDGEDGLLAQLTKLVVESALEGEITDHLGYDKHEKDHGWSASSWTASTRPRGFAPVRACDDTYGRCAASVDRRRR